MTEKDEKLAIEDLDEAAGGNSDYDNEEWLIQNKKKSPLRNIAVHNARAKT